MGRYLLTEINRMKEIMGLSLLSEGIDDLVKKLLGYSEESAQSIAKSADEAGSEFSTALKQIVGGAGTYDDLLSYVSKQGGSVKSVDDIVSFVKSQPELLKKIATSSDAIMKDAAQSIIQRSSIKTLLEKDLIENIEGIILYTVDESDAAMMSKMIDDTLIILNRYSNNADVSDLIKKLKDKKSVVNNMKSTPSVKVIDNTSSKVDSDVNSGSAGTKTDGLGDEFIRDSKIKNVTDSQKSKIESDISSMTDEEATSIVEEISNGTGRFSPGTLSANGFTKENIEKFGNAVAAILKIPFKILSGILTELGFKVQINATKAYLSLFFVCIVGYFGYQWWNGEISLSQALPKIDTADEDCVQNIVGHSTLTEDMKNFVAIEFGCRKTKEIDKNSTDKITGFANVGTNQISVIYSNANCNKIYEISAGGVGTLITDTCDESNSGGGSEEIPNTGEEGALDEL